MKAPLREFRHFVRRAVRSRKRAQARIRPPLNGFSSKLVREMRRRNKRRLDWLA